MSKSRRNQGKPVRASHLGSVVLGAIAGMTAVVVVASAAATVFPDAFKLGEVRVETEAPEVATLPPESEEDVLIPHETEKETETVEETTEAETSSEADLAAEAQKAAEEAAKEAATRAGVTEAEGPAAELTKEAVAHEKEKPTEQAAGPGAEEKPTPSKPTKPDGPQTPQAGPGESPQ